MPKTELGRGAALGISMGALGGAALLVFFAQGLKSDCTGLTSEDCLLDEEIKGASERTALKSAGGLTALGTAGLAFFWLSRRKP